MVFLTDLDLSLPLKNPVIIFSLVLFIILFAPILLNRFKIPHIIGLIIAGVIIGPYGLNLLLRDSSIVLFGTVGLLYIMFTAGLEIDLEEFRKNSVKSLVFGLITFLSPMILGVFGGYYILKFDIPASMLLGSMLASHTLLAYPLTSKYGISRIRSVTLTIGGTIIADILALLVLAGVTGMTRGDISAAFWIRIAISTIIFAAIIFLIFPLIARYFFKRFADNVSQYIFVLALVFLGSFLAEAAGLEPIIGAFLSGLALNRFIPHSSALMNRIDFVGNAIFIPFFLISVGMLINFSELFKGTGALKVAGVMIVLAVLSKFIAAWLTQKSFRLTADERQMIFGLSTAKVGATLAVVLVGYNIILGETPTGEPIRLLNEDVLNGTILMILVTCTLSSLIVEKASRKIAMSEVDNEVANTPAEAGRILIPLGYMDTVPDLLDLALMFNPKKNNIPVYALHVIDDNTDKSTNADKKIMEKAVKYAASTDNEIIPLTRFDANISNGIVYSVKEHDITDIIIGLHHNASSSKNFYGSVVEGIVHRTNKSVLVYKAAQPVNTIKRLIALVPVNAVHEEGFYNWFNNLKLLAKETGLPLIIYSGRKVNELIAKANGESASPVNIVFNEFTDWGEFLIFSREVKQDDLFIIVSSRKGHLSYQKEFEKLPYYLTKHFQSNSFLIIYPKQTVDVVDVV